MKYSRETDSSPYFWKYFYYKLINLLPYQKYMKRAQCDPNDAARDTVVQLSWFNKLKRMFKEL